MRNITNMTTVDTTTNSTAISKYKTIDILLSNLNLNNFSFYILNVDNEQETINSSRITSVSSNNVDEI